ncbi:hypothetical protein SAMN06265348_102190 [Pedobacter westerhofensis]|uniref:Uncharacterized protein n=1 Tax=Pedobacter westerhofensis TaxID=425512 RepID=A0A521BCH9_9SPHI|nr:hypothetical protein SAMN06265348_102190 [Pedobacter westerhofensis]
MIPLDAEIKPESVKIKPVDTYSEDGGISIL